jgi:hypothetical protein
MRKTLLMAALSCCLPMYMSDADAGAPSSSEPVQSPEVIQPGEATTADAAAAQSAGSSSTQASSQASESTSEIGNAAGGVSSDAQSSGATSAGDASTSVSGAADAGNMTGSQPSSALASEPAGEPSRDAHVAHVHSLFEMLETKLATGVHVFAQEVAALRAKVAALL